MSRNICLVVLCCAILLMANMACQSGNATKPGDKTVADVAASVPVPTEEMPSEGKAPILPGLAEFDGERPDPTLDGTPPVPKAGVVNPDNPPERIPVPTLKDSERWSKLKLPQTVASGEGPSWVAIGDLDGDQKLDMAVVEYRQNTVSVFLGRGNGDFHEPRSFKTGGKPDGLALGDFDKDGDLDFVVANEGEGDVGIYLNTGDGTFAETVHYSLGNSLVELAIGDLDGDNDLDIVAANTEEEKLSILINKGKGVFSKQRKLKVGGEDCSCKLGDLDGDGDLDLVVSDSKEGKIAVFLNQGNGQFANPVFYDVGASPLELVLGDLDADGDTDIAVCNEKDGDVSILFNQGNGSFTRGDDIPVSDDAFDDAFDLALGDIDGDSKPDLLVSDNSMNRGYVFLNNGNGTFQKPKLFATGKNPGYIALADLDADSDLDVVVTNFGDDTITILLNLHIP